MPRGAYKYKAQKPVQGDLPSIPPKPTQLKNDWRRPSIPKPSFLVRNTSETKLAIPPLPSPQWEPSSLPEPVIVFQTDPFHKDDVQQDETTDVQTVLPPSVTLETPPMPTESNSEELQDTTTSEKTPSEPELTAESTSSEDSSIQVPESGEIYEESALDTFDDLTIEETRSSTSSTYSRDSNSIYSRSSVCSSASSVYSSGTSVYSFEEADSKDIDSYSRNGSLEVPGSEFSPDYRLPPGMQYQQRPRPMPVRRQEPQDAASRERSSLAKKAALYKNSRLPPDLPAYTTSLSTWSMVCRAVQASQDCYDSQSRTRRGTYTPAETSKDIKAMIIDEQVIDDTRLVIVSIRGTECQSLSDWTVNKNSSPAIPAGFLDDEENACHEGFLQVSKAMMSRVATQLQDHPASSQQASLLFTGHSAGGAVAAMLYSHMLCKTVNSELTALASLFTDISCITFGAPPISLTPLPKRDHGSGVFLSFANEGDPVLRLSNAAYVKSLAKLMTVSLPSAPPTVKVVHRSRGNAVVRKTVLATAPRTPWEELPLWPTPPAPLVNAGEVILLRNKECGNAEASRVTSEDLSDAMFGDLAQHTVDMYKRRVKELAFVAMTGRFAK